MLAILLKWTILVTFLFPIIFILFANQTYAHNVKWMVPKPLTTLVSLGFFLAIFVDWLVVLIVHVFTPCLDDSYLTAFRVAVRMQTSGSYTYIWTKCMCMSSPFFFPLPGYLGSQREHKCDKKFGFRYLPKWCWGSHHFAHHGPLKQCSC